MPEVGTRIERDRRKKNYNWLLQFVADLNGYIQSRIVVGALGPLHPVDDAVLFPSGRAWRPYRDPLILTELFDCIHDGRRTNRANGKIPDGVFPLPDLYALYRITGHPFLASHHRLMSPAALNGLERNRLIQGRQANQTVDH